MVEASRLRALKDALAAHPGEPVPFDDLVTAVWGTGRPANPKAALRNLVQRLRRTDSVVTEPGGYRLVVRPPGPGQLPADLLDFVGRRAQLDRAARTAGTIAITGPPGVGKTTFAIRLAHRLRPDFPDGQLYVNLRAFADGGPLSPQQVLARFLRALGAEEIPVPLEDQQRLYRELLADRRTLLVLDNADRGLIEPLLPQGEHTKVIITSRTDLPEYAQLKLDVFDEHEAHALLDNMRVEGGRGDRAELIRLCAHLPLALRIAGANVADRYLPEYVSELRGDDRLDALQIEGDAAVNATFDLSYKAQPVEAQRLFRLLALIPGQDFGVEAATALLGDDAAEPLGQLAAANLVQRDEDRFSLHDLLRIYAVHLEPEESAKARLLDYYLLNAEAAARSLNPEFFRLDLPAMAEDLPRHDLAAEADAVAWLETERVNIVAAIGQAGADPAAWLLTDMLRGHFYFQSHHADWYPAARAGLKAAQQARNAVAQAAMHGSIGLAQWSSGQLADAVEEYGRALELLRRHPHDKVLVSLLINSGIVHWELGRLGTARDLLTEALELSPDNPAVLFNLGGVHLDLGPLSESIANAMRANEIAVEKDLLVGRILALNAMVEVHQLRGEYDEAERYLAEADALKEGAPAVLSQRLPGLDSHAALALVRGRLPEALDYARRAVDWAKQAQSAKDEVDGYDLLGEVHRALGDPGAAIGAHHESLSISLKSGYLRGEVNALAGLAADHYAAGDLEEALKTALHARERAEEGEMRVRATRVLAVLATIHRSLGDHAAAAEAARTGRALADETGCRYWQGE